MCVLSEANVVRYCSAGITLKYLELKRIVLKWWNNNGNQSKSNLWNWVCKFWSLHKVLVLYSSNEQGNDNLVSKS
jgi:hypothetical protein